MLVAKNLVSEHCRGHVVTLQERIDFFDQSAHAPLIGCDMSHRQGVIHRGFPKSSTACDLSPMAEVFNIDEIRAQLRRVMREKPIAAKTWSKKAGLGETAVRDIMQSQSADPKSSTLFKLADAVNVPVSSLVGSDMVPLTGRIGAGGQIAWQPEGEEPNFVPRPPLAPGPLMALEVSGDSMLPKYEPGDVVYIRRDHEGVLPAYLGRYCAVHTSDGGTYLKRLVAGSKEGLFTLVSLNAADMENVEVIWAAPVLFVWQRQQ